MQHEGGGLAHGGTVAGDQCPLGIVDLSLTRGLAQLADCLDDMRHPASQVGLTTRELPPVSVKGIVAVPREIVLCKPRPALTFRAEAGVFDSDGEHNAVAVI